MTSTKKAGTLLVVAVLVTTALFVGDFMSQPPRPAWATSTTFTSSPTSGAAGTVVAASGSNYAGTTCTLSSSPSGLLSSPTCSISSGTLTGAFTVASGAAVGSYTVTVTTNAGESATASFYVTVPSEKTFVLIPASGAAGTVVTASVSGYAGTACTLSSSPSGLFTSSSCGMWGGALSGVFTVAVSAPAGSYTVTVTTNVPGETGSAMFTVTTATTTVQASTTVYVTVAYGTTQTATDQGMVIQIVSNSIVSSIVFDSTRGLLNFTVSGPSGTYGFFNATMAKTFLLGQPLVLIDGVEHPASVSGDPSFWYIHVTYSHSEHHVTIGGSNMIPEFPSVPLLAILLVLAIVILRRRHKG